MLLLVFPFFWEINKKITCEKKKKKKSDFITVRDIELGLQIDHITR